ncbi:MAG: hypothetical protein LLF28_07205 [Nitrospiraceae bacterium]|nr:hypothetical protein [Nitrospiraceae bacterium]
MDNKFFNAIAPYLSFIDNGGMFRKPFKWLYMIISAINIIWPIYILYIALDSNIFHSAGKVVFVFILMWLTIAFAGWMSFQLWWNRSNKVEQTSSGSNDFVATPVFSHFIQTLGEWAGIWVGFVGFVFALLATIILGQQGAYIGQMMGLSFLKTGVWSIILMPVYGFLIIILARFFAEQWRTVVSIAINTKR